MGKTMATGSRARGDIMAGYFESQPLLHCGNSFGPAGQNHGIVKSSQKTNKIAL